MDSFKQLCSYAKDTKLSHDGFMLVVGLCFDGIKREPGDLSKQETVIRRAFVQDQLGKNARQRKFRKLLARGDDRAVEALNAMIVTWDDWQSAADA